MQDHFKQFFALCSSEMIFSFLIEILMLKAIEIEIAFFHSLGNPEGRTLDYFFYASHIRHNVPYNQLKLSTKTVQVHLIIGTTLNCAISGMQLHPIFLFHILWLSD